MPKEVKKLKETETAEEKANRQSKAHRNRFIIFVAISILLLAVIVVETVLLIVGVR